MNALKTLLAGAALALSAAGANAATYATDVVMGINPVTGEEYTQRGACKTGYTALCADRLDSSKAIGSPESDSNAFYALGLGGWLTLGFGKTFTAPNIASVFEITFDRAKDHHEAADVYSVLNGVETFIGTIFNSLSENTVRIDSAFEYIKLVDVTHREYTEKGQATSSFDGFDVGSVGIAPVPLPAAGAMLLAGLGGFAALRRRKKAA